MWDGVKPSLYYIYNKKIDYAVLRTTVYTRWFLSPVQSECMKPKFLVDIH